MYALYDTFDPTCIVRTFRTIGALARWLVSTESDWYISRGYMWRRIIH